MGKTIGIEITGASELRAKFERLKKELEPAVIYGVNRGLLLVESRSKNRCPVDTGHLRGSIKTSPASSKDDGTVSGLVFTPTEYAIYVECGTGVRGQSTFPYRMEKFSPQYKSGWPGQVAQPYMIPSLLESKTEATKMVALAVKAAIKKGKS